MSEKQNCESETEANRLTS